MLQQVGIANVEFIFQQSWMVEVQMKVNHRYWVQLTVEVYWRNGSNNSGLKI
jgi:hypothetical protein